MSNKLKLIECVPNFSTSDPKILKEIIAEIQKTPKIYILDATSDIDHNRSVITFVGDLESIFEASFYMVKKASELIDLTKHKGVHPFLGATDVLPFIPLQNTRMEECIKLSNKLGEKIGQELKIPIYLYEYASKRTERKNLNFIRNLGYERVRIEVRDKEYLKPDFGPLIFKSAGATSIGARKILIAFNVNIDYKNVETIHELSLRKIAKKIANTIRESNGGLQCVKALGLVLPQQGIAQISMNLTDYEITPPKIVFDKINEECKKYGVKILESELIGLIPKKAIFQGAKEYLKLRNFDESKIIENRIEEISHNDLSKS